MQCTEFLPVIMVDYSYISETVSFESRLKPCALILITAIKLSFFINADDLLLVYL